MVMRLRGRFNLLFVKAPRIRYSDDYNVGQVVANMALNIYQRSAKALVD